MQSVGLNGISVKTSTNPHSSPYQIPRGGVLAMAGHYPAPLARLLHRFSTCGVGRHVPCDNTYRRTCTVFWDRWPELHRGPASIKL